MMNEVGSTNPLLVTGMHRSGTSMATRLLNLCGLHLGDPRRLLTARPDNPQGFWENLDFVTMDDRILARVGAAWDLPPGKPVDRAALSTLLDDFRNPAEACAAATAAGAENRAWGWKDPRGSLLLPFWTAVVPGLQVVVCLRDPREVAASLAKRNGLSTQLGLHLWERYNERLENDLQAEPGTEYIVTHYEALLAHPREELRRLIDWLGWQVADETIDEACASIKPELRHHRPRGVSLAEGGASADQVELYARWCERAGPHYAASTGNSNDELEAMNRRGETCFAAGEFSAAADIFRELLDREAANVRGRNNLACSLWQSGCRDEAVSELAQALQNEPDDADATWNLGQFLRDMGRRADADRLFRSYLDRHPEASDFHRELGVPISTGSGSNV
jgi:hypothetical protein